MNMLNRGLATAAAGLAGLAAAAPSYGQWVYNGNNIYTTAPFVGVGSTSPINSAERFDVRVDTGGYGGMYVRTTGWPGFPFYGYVGNGNFAWHYLDGNNGTWKLYNNGDRLAVTNTGLVGIGTMSPSNPLSVAGNADVSGTFSAAGPTIVDSSNTNNGAISGAALRFGGAGSGEGIASRRTSAPNQYGLDFYTASAPRLTITNLGKIGVGMTNPTFPFDMTAASGGGLTRSMNVVNTGNPTFPDTDCYGVWGETVGTTVRGGAGVKGVAQSPEGNGVLGECGRNDRSGFGAGVRGISQNIFGGQGVRGDSNGDYSIAVYGFAWSRAMFPGATYGVMGYTHDTNAGGYAVFADGNSGANGTKSFRIDHPDDPANKYLLHYSAEAPEPQNFYNGVVTLDPGGGAWVTLPPYFASINRDPRYSLTAIGAAMPLLHVAEEIDERALATGAAAQPGDAVPECSFRIAGGMPDMKVSWEVKAIRNDAWVRTYGAPVEVEKTGPERGKYQHPELYGQPPEMGMPYRSKPLRQEPPGSKRADLAGHSR